MYLVSNWSVIQHWLSSLRHTIIFLRVGCQDGLQDEESLHWCPLVSCLLGKRVASVEAFPFWKCLEGMDCRGGLKEGAVCGSQRPV